jgi:hypothetical protein
VHCGGGRLLIRTRPGGSLPGHTHIGGFLMVCKRVPLRRINQNIPGDLYDRLAATAVREDRTKSAVLVRALEAYIGVSEQTAERRGDSAAGDPGLPGSFSTSLRRV